MTTELRADVSGTVWRVLVTAGERVSRGQEVVIVESMKMEIPHEAPCDGIVGEIVSEPQSYVEEGDTLMRLDDG